MAFRDLGKPKQKNFQEKHNFGACANIEQKRCGAFFSRINTDEGEPSIVSAELLFAMDVQS